VLAGCVVGGEDARHDMEESKAAYKACLAPQESEACDGLRQAYEADRSAYRATPKFVIGAGSYPALPHNDVGFDGMGAMPIPALPPMHDFLGDAMAPPDLPPVSSSPMHSCINTGNFAFCQ
jgi:hypothetical protein